MLETSTLVNGKELPPRYNGEGMAVTSPLPFIMIPDLSSPNTIIGETP